MCSPSVRVEFCELLNDLGIIFFVSGKGHRRVEGDTCTYVHKNKRKKSGMQCTHIYFKRLMESMGEKVKFAIDEVCQGAGRTAAVMWHLEWNGYIIPFSRGCSFYICSVNGAVLLIRKIHIFNESPLKPGKWALVGTLMRLLPLLLHKSV